MAHHKDALKRTRQNEKRRARNQAVQTMYRNKMRKVRDALAEANLEAASAALKPALVAVDKAVTKGILKKNTASRYKSRLTLAVNRLKASKQAA